MDYEGGGGVSFPIDDTLIELRFHMQVMGSKN